MEQAKGTFSPDITEMLSYYYELARIQVARAEPQLPTAEPSPPGACS